MNALTNTLAFLADALTADPFTLLAGSVAWLDPLWQVSPDDMESDGNELMVALLVVRDAFPDIYAEAVERLHTRAPDRDLERFMCAAITAKGIPIDQIEAVHFGIPLTAFGVLLDDPDTYDHHPDLLAIVRAFGVRPDADRYGFDVPQTVYTAGNTIYQQLHASDDANWCQVGWAVGWMFGCTGNSLVDFDAESLYEMEPLRWEPDDIAFAVELIEEADGIMADVSAGLKLLQYDTAMRDTFIRNAKRLVRHLEKGNRDAHRCRLEWPSALGRAERDPGADAEFLLVRGDAA